MADEVIALDLVDPSGAELPAWQAGAHIDVVFGPDRSVRQYSLCGDPEDRQKWRIAVLREANGHGGSVFMHDRVRVGDTVEVRPPHNSFALTVGRPIVFIAGGIGITPFLPMIMSLRRLGVEWYLHYVGRSPTSMAFADALVAANPEHVSVYAKAAGQRLDIDAVFAALDPHVLVYACGPGRMLDAVKSAGAAYGIETRIERFMVPDGPRKGLRPDTAFEVHLARSGMTFTVLPGETILARAEEEGVVADCSCLEGICGTCETRVLEGEPEHCDYVLEGDPKDTMMICVSRARSKRLTLDL